MLFSLVTFYLLWLIRIAVPMPEPSNFSHSHLNIDNTDSLDLPFLSLVDA